MATWFNNDGLLVRFALDKVLPLAPRGEMPGAGEYREESILVDFTKTVAGTVFPLWGANIPSNSFISGIRTSVVTAITTATNITFGLQFYDGTELDYDGFLTQVTGLTTIGTVTDYVKGTANAGALVGTVLTRPGTLVVTPTGQPGAGLIELVVKFWVPKKNPVPVVNL